MDPWDAPEPKKLNSLPQAPARRRGPSDALSSIPGLPGAEHSAKKVQTTEEEGPAFDSLDAPGISTESGENGEFQVIMTPPPAKNRATPKSGGLRESIPPTKEKPSGELEVAPPTEETEMVPIAAEVDSIQAEESAAPAVGLGEVSGLHFTENFSGSSFDNSPVRKNSKVPLVIGVGVLLGVLAGAAAYVLVFGVGGDGPATDQSQALEEQPAAVAPIPTAIPEEAPDTDPLPQEEDTDPAEADVSEELGGVIESGNEGVDALSQENPKGNALKSNSGAAKKPVKRRVKSAPADKSIDEQSGADKSNTDEPVTPAPTQNDVGLSASSSGIRLPKVGKRNRPAKKRLKKEKPAETAAEEPAPAEPAKTEEAAEEENPWGNLGD